MNSLSRCGRSLSSNEESSSTGAAETSLSFRSGFCFTEAIGGMLPRLHDCLTGEQTESISAVENIANRKLGFSHLHICKRLQKLA
jgi:hypothetical protein